MHMDMFTIVLIILGIWIYTLDIKVKNLETIIKELREHLLGESSHYVNESIIEEKMSHAKREERVDALQIEDVKIHKKLEEKSKIKAFPEGDKSIEDSITLREPSALMRLLTNYFTGGNLLVRIGGVILFLGLAFLVKYAAAHSMISIKMRLIGIAVVAIVLVVIGWRLRDREGAYGQILQGLGIAMLYLVIYGASKFYTLLSLEFAFVLMFIVVIVGSALALRQNSLPLAFFSTSGGFLVPILTSTGEGSHVLLFSYYLLLNVGVFFMAWKRAWRVLNVVGFLFTFVIATSWGVLRYKPTLFLSTEPFLILYFLMYLSITVLFVRKSEGHLIDGTLLFGLPAVVFPLQIYLVSDIAYGAGYSALVLGTLYIVLSKVLKKEASHLLLLQSFLGLGLLFFTIAVPYFFDADISASIWTMESASVIWLSLKQSKVFTRYFGELLLCVSVGLYLFTVFDKVLTPSMYLGYMIVFIATFFVAYQLERHKETLERDSDVSVLFFALSIFVWMISVWRVAEVYAPYHMMHKMLLGFLLGTFLVYLADRFLQWKLLGRVLQVTLPVGIVLFLLGSTNLGLLYNPFRGLGIWGFFTLILWQIYLLYHYKGRWEFASYLHIVLLWFTVAVLSLELRYMSIVNSGSETMTLLAISLLPLLTVFVFINGVFATLIQSKYLVLYRSVGVGGLLVFLLGWEVISFFSTADSLSLPYIPLLNPLDIVQVWVFMLSMYWMKIFNATLDKTYRNIFYAVGALFIGVLASIIFARAVHYYQALPYQFNLLWHDLYFQTGLSILWSIIAIVLMLFSKRYRNRQLWIAGFGLLIVVVLKLFFVELSSSGSIERIISFIVVGLLLLLIGYFVPLPPESTEQDGKL